MRNGKFRAIVIPILALFLLIVITLNSAANALASTLDTYVGKGEKYVQTPKEREGWDAQFYRELYADSNASAEGAYAVAKQVAQEGSILLKNDGVLPLEQGTEVMPFGSAYLDPIYGQLSSGGSAKWVVDPVTPEQGLSAFRINNAAADCMKKAGKPEEIKEADGTIVAGEAGTILGGDCIIYEYDPTIYADLGKNENATGIVFITRSGQEGQDQKYDAYEDGTPHYLALTENEKGTIRAAKQTCGKVVVVLVASAAMELGPIMTGDLEVNAILWVGHPGERGMETLSDLLDGTVNPSGRTVDIYPMDLTSDPTYQNIGESVYSNLDMQMYGYMGGLTDPVPRLYTEYQEGMYMGYRYYETADAVDDTFVYGELDGKGSIKTLGAVAYPFGYGLSYTEFTQELISCEETDGQIVAKVKVTNVGEATGKEVVQLYYSAPYTQLDVDYKIEKPIVNLIAFDKTSVLKPGESEEVTLTFAKEDMTSYCYTHQNSDGSVGCYMLEEGEYQISLRKNSHDVIAEAIISQNQTVWYDGTTEELIRDREILAQSALDENGESLGYPAKKDADESAEYIAATNQFQSSSDYMNKDSVILSRADWNGTQPKAAEGKTKEISQEFADLMSLEVTFDVNTDPVYGNVEGSLVYAEEAPISNADNGLKLSDMRGLSYYDTKWDLLLDQIDWEADKDGFLLSFAGAAYVTGAVESIGLPATEEYDGANGLKVKGSDNGYDMSKSSSFGFAPLMAATWNEDLAYEIGAAFGQEALQNNINGWYCPAINLHRSAFSGRVFEYYSEDPVLSGKFAARVISGAGDQGMFCYLKHFALNDTETGRALLANYWADEQTMRELYMKAFEIAIEEAKMTIQYLDENGTTQQKTMRAATAVMPAQNCVGTIVGECNYALLQNVLRGEWGFQGVVVSDYWVWADNSIRDLALRTGCDTYLCMAMPSMWNLDDYDSATARTVMRTAIKNLCYTVANSNAMQGLAPGAVVKESMQPWKKILIAADVVSVLLAAAAIVWMVRRHKDEKLHPENYKTKKQKKIK